MRAYELNITESVDTVEHYLGLVSNLPFEPVSKSVWDTIQDEGLDEEFNKPKKNQWRMTTLPISDFDAEALKQMDDEVIEKFNHFDIMLKDKFQMRVIDFINYDAGEVVLVIQM